MLFFKKSGVLGINARNLLYIRPYNKKKAIKLADDKLKTKQFLAARGVPVPKLYAVIKNGQELDKFDFAILPNSFVVKPNKGYGGEGIIPIIKTEDGKYITAGNKVVTKEDLKEHIQDILDGRFSISNVADYTFFEQYIIADDRIAKYSYEGLPDIRVVVHNLIPVMAMLRLPTKESEGKANLHMGAVGVGIDIGKGEATHITYRNKIIPELPNNLGKIKGLKIPYWDQILETASKVQLNTNLGYMAIDICIDKNIGPVLLEINARAGLGVQIANLAPLRKRLERIEGVKVTSPTKGVRIAKDMFGNIAEKSVATITGKQVISTQEDVEIILKEGTLRVKAQINTGKNITTIDEELAEKAGLLEDAEAYDDEKSTLKVKFTLKGQRIQTIANIEKITKENFKMVIGKRDLKNFLIDTSVVKVEPKKEKIIAENKADLETKQDINMKKIDQELIKLDSKIKLLYHLRPLNLEEEERKFFNNINYNPHFNYPQLKFDPLELTEALNKIETDGSPLGLIFENKKREILRKIKLIESIGEERFTNYSINLFGKPSEEEITECLKWLKEIKPEPKKEENYLTLEEIELEFKKTFEAYGLDKWKVKIKDNMVADCVAGKNNSMFVRKDAKFTKERITSLIVHEIETHIITAENGKNQPYEIFGRGLSNYLITQEGMAMYNVEKQMKMPFKSNSKAITHVLTINKAITNSFSQTYKYLTEELNISAHQAFRSCVKAKRGFTDTALPGAFTKDYIYYKGYKQIKKFIENEGNMADLYRGKFNLDDLPKIKQIPSITPPKILPTWLNY